MQLNLREPKKIVPLCIAALFFLTFYINSSPCMAKILFYPMYREIKKCWFIIDNMDSNVMSTDNFNIYYKDTETQLIDMIGNTAERSLKRVIGDFDYKIKNKINIIVYTDYKKMANKIGLGTSGSAAMGIYYGGTISILEPSKWIKNKEYMEDIFEKQGPILHELTHYVMDYMTCGNIPVWFTEGVALYEEYRTYGTEWAPNRWYTDYYNAEKLENDFYKLDEVKAYRQSFLVVRYLAESYGTGAIINIAEELKRGKSMEQASQNVLGIDVHELFKQSLKGDGKYKDAMDLSIMDSLAR